MKLMKIVHKFTSEITKLELDNELTLESND